MAADALAARRCQRAFTATLLMLSLAQALCLTPIPVAVNEWTRGTGARSGLMAELRSTAAMALIKAQRDGMTKIEIELPPLLSGKTQFDDFSNVEELDANRDFAMQMSLLEGVQQQPSEGLWLCFPDDKEAELAVDAWPGQAYQSATITTIAEAVRSIGGEPQEPLGAAAAAAGERVARALGLTAAPPRPTLDEPLPAPCLQLIVQPGNGGPMEDWMNLEKLYQPSVPMVVLNGALDKVRTGYYPAIFYPEFAKCATRFYSDFEAAYYLRFLGGIGWLFRVYPEPWQLVRQQRDELQLVETFARRPLLADAVARLRGGAAQ